MSTNREVAISPLQESDQGILMRLIRRELLSIPVEQWGFFFPCHIAVWRFIETKYPGFIGPLKAAYRDEPYFEGKGSKWFCEILANSDEYLDLLEAIIYPITKDASDEIRESVRHRGFFLDNEIPQIDPQIIMLLTEVIHKKVEEGVREHFIE